MLVIGKKLLCIYTLVNYYLLYEKHRFTGYRSLIYWINF